ncbi:universal stress protein [Propionispora vibrioides]|jgi:nucleotide-binding universal stress UspA family protein|uniref:Nucleotide-binding universal stress protein, UspA family n=1 Tax=Propionispora vibrioides TaxID=112903 RepID=A0A1H8VYL7_9FIRM|nr:universal stress protein [Propionispora vibrioides]SEP20486.1 Nucleotide-binding universal stress protein, UspA family [Propionispora vibrioides]
MEMVYKKILVPVDGSRHSIRALLHAEALARSFAGELNILYVSVLSQQVPLYDQIQGSKIPPHAAKDPASFAKAILAEATQLVPKDIPVKTYNELGEPRTFIIDFANNNECDVIVVGSRGLGTIAGLFLGSVSTYVVHHATCPVLVVH